MSDDTLMINEKRFRDGQFAKVSSNYEKLFIKAAKSWEFKVARLKVYLVKQCE